MSVLLHPDVSEQLANYSSHLPHALLVTGKSGVGLDTLARHLAKDMVMHAHITPELLTKTSTIPQISVGRIRELYAVARSKQVEPALIIINDADSMTESAQNAFLKLLEEPPANTHFILTSHSPENLLPTIKSRSQVLYIRPITTTQSEELLDMLPALDSTKRRQILFIAEGLPAEMSRLSSDEAHFRKRSERIRIAKQLAEGTTQERLSVLLNRSFTRDEAVATVRQLISLLELRPQPATTQRITKLLKTLDRLEAGGNTKLQLAVGVL